MVPKLQDKLLLPWVHADKPSFPGSPVGFLSRCLHLLWCGASKGQCIILNQLPFRQHSL